MGLLMWHRKGPRSPPIVPPAALEHVAVRALVVTAYRPKDKPGSDDEMLSGRLWQAVASAIRLVMVLVSIQERRLTRDKVYSIQLS
jgi:hypothetical protein